MSLRLNGPLNRTARATRVGSDGSWGLSSGVERCAVNALVGGSSPSDLATMTMHERERSGLDPERVVAR